MHSLRLRVGSSLNDGLSVSLYPRYLAGEERVGVNFLQPVRASSLKETYRARLLKVVRPRGL